MKNMLGKTWLIGIVILFIGASVIPSISANINEAGNITREQPQPLTVFWEDNFDSYDEGSSMHGQGGWKGWDDLPAGTAYVSADQSLSSPHSVDIVGDADLVHEYSGCTSGQWTYTTYVYVPSDLMGLSYFILLSDYVDGAGANNKWAVQTWFDNDQGLFTHDNGENLPLVTDEWVEIRVEIDLDADWHELYYDGDLLYERAWTAGPFGAGDGFLNIAAVDLFANLATSVYYDDMSLEGEVTSEDLDCDGILNWEEIEAGATVNGEFTIENIGAAESLLDWEIESYPDWGTWTFEPETGTGLTPEAGVITIAVEVIAPDSGDEFTGEVKIVNSNNPADFCVIDAAMTDAVSQQSLIQLFFERHPNAFPLLRNLLGL